MAEKPQGCRRLGSRTCQDIERRLENFLFNDIKSLQQQTYKLPRTLKKKSEKKAKKDWTSLQICEIMATERIEKARRAKGKYELHELRNCYQRR